MKHKCFSGVNAAIQDTALVVETVILGGEYDQVVAEVANKAGGSALTNFAVELNDHPESGDSGWYTYLSGADFAVASDSMPFCTTTAPNTLAAGSRSHFHVRTRGAWAMRFKGTGAAAPAAAAEVTVRGTARGSD